MGIHGRRFAAIAVISVSLLAGVPRAAAPEITELLNRYERGEFAAVARAVLDIPAAPPFTKLRMPKPGYWSER